MTSSWRCGGKALSRHNHRPVLRDLDLITNVNTVFEPEDMMNRADVLYQLLRESCQNTVRWLQVYK